MAEREKSLEEIREAGIRALIAHLGPVGMVRFLQQFGTGSGDYTAERKQWLGDPDLESLAAEVQRNRHEPKS
jgi:hypothetical protein